MKRRLVPVLICVVLLVSATVSSPVLADDGAISEEAAHRHQLGRQSLEFGLYSVALEHLGIALLLYEGLNNLEQQAYVQYDIGTCYGVVGDALSAISAYRAALDICGSLLDTDVRALQASILLSLANLYGDKPDYKEAVIYFTEAADIYVALHEWEEAMFALFGSAFCYQQLEMYGEAIRYYQETLMLCRTRMDWYSDFGPIILREVAACHYKLSECSEALDAYEAALEIGFLSGGLREREYIELRIDLLLLVSLCYRASAQFETSIAICQEALELSQSVDSIEGEAACFNALGLTYMEASSFIEALRSFQASLEINQQMGSEERATEIGKTFNNIGNCYVSLGNPREAMSYHEKAREIFAQTNLIPNLAMVYCALASNSHQLEDLPQALYDIQQAAYYFQMASMLADQVGVLVAAAGIHWEMGQSDQAHQCSAAAEGVLEQIPELRDRAYCLSKLGALNCWVEDYELGFSYLSEAREIYRSLADYTGQMRSLMEIAYWHIQLENYEEGARVSQQLIDLLESGDRNGAVQAHWRLARCQVGLADLDSAKGTYETVISIVEDVRSAISMESLSHSFGGTTQEIYQEYLELLAKMGVFQESLLYAERARSRSLLDILVSGAALGEPIAGVEGLSTQSTVNEEEISASIEMTPELLDEGEAVLVYSWGLEHLFIWVVTTHGIEGPFVQDLNYDQFFVDVYTFRSGIETVGDGSVAVALQQIESQSQLRDFYDVLVLPVLDRLVGKNTLIIIPSGPLWYVPFAALRTEDEATSYLIEDFAIAYAPSLASLSALLLPKTAEPSAELLPFANPTRDDMSPLPDYLEEAARSFSAAVGGNMPYIKEDATESLLKRMLPVFLGGTAEGTEESAKRYRYILFACHGMFSHTNPLFSYLALAGDQEEDGDVYAREILEFDLTGTEIVLLMACETFLPAVESRVGAATAGLGADLLPDDKLRVLRYLVQGDELVGLSRAFLLAGAEAVLATHWEVQVGAASQLARALGEALASDIPKAEALQSAQLQLIEAGQTDPWIWAPFLLIGDWR
ncbi:CHAT domain-containing protein [Candidatus Bipolaricaulota bacterium]|nr:CHAT domain-containing protein [Candidatus Bipolaricaulota bacterium]